MAKKILEIDPKKDLIRSIKNLVIEAIVNQAKASIFTKIPFLTFGPFAWIASLFLQKFVRFLVDQTILGATFLYIDISNQIKVRAVETAISNINKAKKEGASDDELRELDKELAKTGRDLIRLSHII